MIPVVLVKSVYQLHQNCCGTSLLRTAYQQSSYYHRCIQFKTQELYRIYTCENSVKKIVCWLYSLFVVILFHYVFLTSENERVFIALMVVKFVLGSPSHCITVTVWVIINLALAKELEQVNLSLLQSLQKLPIRLLRTFVLLRNADCKVVLAV